MVGTMAKSRGMDAVIEKSSKASRPTRKPALKRKGPGIAIMIAVGKPKPGQGMGMGKPMQKREDDEPTEEMGPKAFNAKVAMVEARIAELEAKLAELDGDAGEMDEEEDEDEDE